jgi:hypothetical protein
MSRHLTHLDRPSRAWVNFSYICFTASVSMAGGGIFALPLGGWARVRFAAGKAIVVQSCFTLAKIMRDRHEASRMINRIEAASISKLSSADKA